MVYAQLLTIFTWLRIHLTNSAPDVILLLFRTSETMLEPSVVLYIYHGICRHMNPVGETCFNLGMFPDKQDEVQASAAQYITWYRFLWNLPALGLTLFCGAWSDQVGRKLVLVLPCIGTIVTVFIYLISTLKAGYYLPMVLCGAVIRGTFGGTAVLLMAVQSYISDTTSIGHRTWRFGMLLAMNYFGNVLGYIIMGIVLNVANFEDIFCIVIILQSVCVVWALMFMTNKTPLQEESDADTSILQKGRFLFKLQHLKDAFQVLIRPREGGGRRHICLLLTAVVVNQIGREVEGDIMVLFVERRPLNWGKSMYGYLAATDFSCMGLLVCAALPILSYRYQIPDMYLVILGICAKVIRLLILSFSTSTWHIYIAILIGSLIAITVSALKSLLSKVVDAFETGKMFSLVSFGETLSSLFGSLVFSNLYAATASVFPGFSFLITSFLYLILLVMMVTLTTDMISTPAYNTLHEELTEIEKCETKSTESIDSILHEQTSLKDHTITGNTMTANSVYRNGKVPYNTVQLE